jgi:hypothetical protein
MEKEVSYWKTVEGSMVEVKPIDEICKILKIKFDDLITSESHWREKFLQSQSSTYKDDEIEKLTKEIENLKERLKYGFGVSAEENNAILEWYNKHKKHCENCSLVYHFTPTPLGVCGEAVCTKCGEKFTFQDLG